MMIRLPILTSLVLVACAAAPVPPVPPAHTTHATVVMPPVLTRARDASVNGIKIHYLVAGPMIPTSQPPAVLLHGYAESSHMWLPVMRELAKTRMVIAPDLRGAGESEIAGHDYRKTTMAEDVHALVESLGFHRVVVAGHDIGLMVAYAYAAEHPREVERLALMDAFIPGVGDWQNVVLTRTWHFRFYGSTPEQLVKGHERLYLEHFWNDFAADPARSVSEADREIYARNYARAGAMGAGFTWFQELDRDARELGNLAKTKLTMPVLAIAGERSMGGFLGSQVEAVATDAQDVVIPNAGHWLIEEAPAQTIPRLVTFLNGGV